MSRESSMISDSLVSECTMSDLKDPRVPSCLAWTVQQVADWMEGIGFPDYRVSGVGDIQ